MNLSATNLSAMNAAVVVHAFDAFDACDQRTERGLTHEFICSAQAAPSHHSPRAEQPLVRCA